jgi:hypothetical protein
MDLTKLSDADLLALKAGDYSKMSDDGLKALKVSSSSEDAPVTASGTAKAVAAGAAKGVLGLVGGIPALSAAAKATANKYLFDPILGPRPDIPSDQKPFDINAAASPDALQGYVEKATGEFHKPQNTTEKYADTIGSMLPGVVGGPEALASRLVTRAAIPGAASEAAGQATEGTSLEPYARFGGAVLGGVAGAKLAAARSATPLQAMPDVDAVKAAASAGYNDPAVMALRVRGGAVNSAGNDIAQSLEGKGFFPEDHGGVYSAVNRLRNAGPSVSYNELDAIRKSLGNQAGQLGPDFRPTPTAAAAGHAKGLLDDFINLDMTNPNNVLTGNPVAARQAIQTARANSGAAIRSDQVSKLLNNAEVDAGAANSGMNIQNRIRQTIKPFLKNGEAKMAGYNDAERASMNSLVRGSGLMNALRYTGNAIGGGGISVLPGAFLGHAALGPAGYALPAVGFGMKKLANAITTRQTQNLASQLLARAPLSQSVAATNSATKFANAAAAHQAMLSATLRSSALANGNQPQ